MRVPKVYWECTSPEVLVLEYMPGGFLQVSMLSEVLEVSLLLECDCASIRIDSSDDATHGGAGLKKVMSKPRTVRFGIVSLLLFYPV